MAARRIVTQVDCLRGERHLAGDDAGDIQHFFNQADLRLCVALDDLDGMRGARVEVAGAQDPGPPENRVEWGPQLVRQRAQELVLEPIGFLCLPIQLDAIERQPDSPCHFFEDERIRRPQAPLGLRDERQDGLDPPVNHQRDNRGRRRAKGLRRHGGVAGSNPRRRDAGQGRFQRRVAVDRGETNRPVVAGDVHHRCIRDERHRQAVDDVDELVERHERRETIREVGQERQRLALLDVVAETTLDGHSVRDIDRVPEYVRGSVLLLGEDVPIHPHAGRAVRCDDAHHPGIVPMLLDPQEVLVEQGSFVGRKKVAQIATDPEAGLISERVRRGGIDRKDRSGEVVRTDQAEAALDQFAVPPFAFAKCLGGLLPGGGYPLNRGRVTLSHGPDWRVIIGRLPASYAGSLVREAVLRELKKKTSTA